MAYYHYICSHVYICSCAPITASDGDGIVKCGFANLLGHV